MITTDMLTDRALRDMPIAARNALLDRWAAQRDLEDRAEAGWQARNGR